MRFKALLVANWEYHGASNGLAPLKGPRNDLSAMRDALTHRHFGLCDPANIESFENLTSAQIGREFLRFLQDTGKEDRLVLYYSGHGERRSDETLALCGVDTEQRYLEATSFNTGELRSWIEGSNRAPSTIVILDCCYAGRMKSGLSEQTLVGSLGAGTMVLASGANQPTKDALNETDPSPFTAALARILVDPDVNGDLEGWLTVDNVYQQLINIQPPLLPGPYRNVHSQGTFPLAKREPPAMPKRPELRGFQAPEQVEIVDLKFGATTVTARWQTGETTILELTALDSHRRMAMRRLSQLADAVIRVPEYAKDVWYQQTVQKAWDCVGINLFETAIPGTLRDRIHSGIDGTGRRLLKLRLTFEQDGDSLECYPWEYLRFEHSLGTEPVGGDESLPLALRPGLLIERVATARPPMNDDSRLSGTAPTVGVINCLYDNFARAATRVTDDLTRLADLNLIMDLKGTRAHWGDFLDAFAQAPGTLLLFAPVRRSPEGVQIGFIADEPGPPEWHLGSELTWELRNAQISFNSIILVTFAAQPGQDSFRGTLELARGLAWSGLGPVVFVCHAPGFEHHYLNLARDTFPVLFVDALTQDLSLDQAFYYAKDRITRRGSADVRRAFGVPGYYASAPADRRSAGPTAATPGGLGTEVRARRPQLGEGRDPE